MPLFEYQCEQCSYRFDRIVLSTNTKVQCPLCQANVKKLMSSFSIGNPHAGMENLPKDLQDIQPKMCTNC